MLGNVSLVGPDDELGLTDENEKYTLYPYSGICSCI